MLKIIHIISSLRRGGRERQLSVMVSNTNLDKYPTKIIYFNEAANDYIKEYKLPDFLIKIKSKNFFSRLLTLSKLIRDQKPEIVYAWGNFESIFILILKFFHKFKFINGSVRHGIRSQKFSHYFRTFILHLSSIIIANSKAGLRANNLKRGHVLYNGVDNRFIGRLPEHKKIEKRKELLSSQVNTVLMISVANLVPYKDYDTILKALKRLKEKKINFDYLILGDGPLRKIIEQKIREYRLDENVTILGNVKTVREYLQLSDIFIHSSKGEGCSNAILEAMAAGLPIIASNTGGTSEIVCKENGFLFEYKNYLQLESLIEACVGNPEMCRKLGESSLDQIKKKFTIEAMMKNYYKILNQITSR